MTKLKAWFSVSELRGLPGMPETTRGVLLRTRQHSYESRKRRFGKGLEYAFKSLPAVTQDHLRAGAVAVIGATPAAPQAPATVVSLHDAAEPSVRAMADWALVQQQRALRQMQGNTGEAFSAPCDAFMRFTDLLSMIRRFEDETRGLA